MPELFAAAIDGAQVYPGRFPDHPEAVAIADAFLHNADADDYSATDRLRRMVPLYLADYFGRRAEYDAMISRLRYYYEPTSADDPAPFDTRGRLAEITAPTLVLVGAQDFICGPRWARMLHDGIPGSELVILEGSGHFPHLEETAAFVRAVAATVDRVRN